ncbi:MAG: bifunctional metallophosphatase/5'-nucleotidase, partial [Actinomycetia bacterium]|nr:bifunctional metallophosphatase/5'-nucleotidase [Actinomycetes bacterium]
MAHLNNLTLLHSNDLHGDFLTEKVNEKLVGGISMLSGYVSKVRAEIPNTLYCIAGDMLQGSIIDREFHGISTIEIMNMLAPDVATIGNHEVDYGLAHLLFLERCAKFPIVNANLYIKNPYTRLFQPQKILKVDGMNIMFIGITTDDILAGLKGDILGSFVNLEQAAQEVGNICNAYKHIDVDFTVLLTHIGYDEDQKLAALLDPDWGVDVIIGGHTHTILEHPAEVNGVLIAQAGIGTDQIGRFDIVINTDTNSVDSYQWQLVPITPMTAPRDPEMEKIILSYQEETDQKYNRVICRFKHPLTHPSRYEETELGDLLADIIGRETGVDILMLGSGSVRKKQISTVLRLQELIELFPYDDKLIQLTVTGRQFRQMLRH